ncbi:MAG: DNA-directed DNA polymerase [Candidatus Micrarchaeia archaeon]
MENAHGDSKHSQNATGEPAAHAAPKNRAVKKALKEKTRSAVLIETDYIIKNNQTYVRLQMKAKSVFYLYDIYEPYFYVDAPKSEIEKLMQKTALHRGQKIKPKRIEQVEMEVEGHKRHVLKVFANFPPEVPDLRSALKDYPAWEYNIPFGRRYMIDKKIGPLMKVTYKRKGKIIEKIIKRQDSNPKFRMLAFDIETYNPVGAPRPQKDPSIMISYATSQKLEDSYILTYKDIEGRPFSKNCKTEKGMIEELSGIIKKEDPEIVVGYNSTNFDLPYLAERAKATKANLAFGRDGSSFSIKKRGMRDVAKIRGRIYIDLFPLLRFLAFIGAVKLNRFTLEAAYESVVGKKSEWKQNVERLEIYKMWDEKKLNGPLADYSRIDAQATWELAQKVLPLELEMSKVTHMPPTDIMGATSSQLVESLLMYEAGERGAIVPNRPDENEVKARMMNPIEGAFVKTPNAGIYENIMVFDFRGLYPSIIISHNIDPFTINPKGVDDKDCFISPTGAKFAKHPKGLLPDVLEKVITARGKLKDSLKKLEPETDEYRAMWARQQSLKILANSYYGYLAFARSRYYSRSAAESVTAWGRHFITKTIESGQEAGFEVLYADTDSAFLLLGDKKKEDALKWMEKVNKTLPGTMELELEGFFPRGVFVSKKSNTGAKTTGAKKKYALIDEKGKLKIRGFELVRRDWSIVARETQKAVLDAILKDGSKDKAVEIVKKVVQEVRAGTMPMEKMVIQTQLTKDLDKYEIKSPELVAALKANKRGHGEKLARGSVVRYIVTRTSNAAVELEKSSNASAQRSKTSKNSVSDKAEVVEMAKDYDADYYINHQIIPTVLKILKELGVQEEDLKSEGKQKGLDAFF